MRYYRHFKGGLYHVVCTGRHSETEEVMVGYYPWGKPKDLWFRPLKMFTEMVEHEGNTVPRFRLIPEDEPIPELTKVLDELRYRHG